MVVIDVFLESVGSEGRVGMAKNSSGFSEVWFRGSWDGDVFGVGMVESEESEGNSLFCLVCWLLLSCGLRMNSASFGEKNGHLIGGLGDRSSRESKVKRTLTCALLGIFCLSC